MTQELTPLMRQYKEMKATLPPKTLLLCRLGDFYELFFEDAEIGAEILEIVLTKRHNVSMAGVPYHALENYLPKLFSLNIKVAIAEQVEPPTQSKKIVKRQITRIITPGTIIDDTRKSLL